MVSLMIVFTPEAASAEKCALGHEVCILFDF